MKKILLKILIIFSLFTTAFPQNKINQDVEQFFTALIQNEENLSQYVLPDELEKSNRLGITYDDVENKFLISYDIDENVKHKINGGIKYQIYEENLGNGFSKVSFSVDELNYKKDYYFKDNKLISPSSYHTKDWEKLESKYFKVFESDPELFNKYSLTKLDEFSEAILNLLKVDEAGKILLEKEKIIYTLCRDEKEIEKVSGFVTRGIYILAYDEIITTFNCHFHEVAHLLMNFKLKNLPLFTLPFLQEGFATAVGGRGGLGRNILLDAGYFLQKSEFVTFNSILTKEKFISDDASVTYPVAAIYNYFLMNQYGIESYLDLYERYSGSSEFVNELDLNSIELSSADAFYKFIDNYKKRSGVKLSVEETFKDLIEIKSGVIKESPNNYMLKIPSNLLLASSEKPENYSSKKFKEIFPNINYNGEKYLIVASSKEVNIYNLFTNNLIASYSIGFSEDFKEVTIEDGLFKFYIEKNVFDEKINNMNISEI